MGAAKAYQLKRPLFIKWDCFIEVYLRQTAVKFKKIYNRLSQNHGDTSCLLFQDYLCPAALFVGSRRREVQIRTTREQVRTELRPWISKS